MRKDIRITINTESGIEEVQTPLIKGELNCIIIDSMDIISITIDSSLGYPIYHNSQHSGVKYYAPRAVLQGWESRLQVKDQFNEFVLNEVLNIRINGPKNSEVVLIFRYEEDE